jgi:hypothetical protein
MPVDYVQLQAQIDALVMDAIARQQKSKGNLDGVLHLLELYSHDLERLSGRVACALEVDASLRCAGPSKESLDAQHPLPELPQENTVLAADGSQAGSSRHDAVSFGVINTAVFRMDLAAGRLPASETNTQLLFGEQQRFLNGESLAMRRDIEELRSLLAVACEFPPGTIALLDGSLELWGARNGTAAQETSFQQALQQHLDGLQAFSRQGAVLAGYVDRPLASLVVRLLEVAMVPEAELTNLASFHPLEGVSDLGLFARLLSPGSRSAVFAICSRSGKRYAGELGLHFFYLNVGWPDAAHIARVEIPTWVANDEKAIDCLQAVLIAQCRELADITYPYALYRAHEEALVTYTERQAIEQMILDRLGELAVYPEPSPKQIAKGMTQEEGNE